MLKKFFYSFLTIFLLFIIFSFFPLGSFDSDPEMEIYLISNEIHTDLVLPIRNSVFDWESFIDPLAFKNRPSEWIEIGWGDRQFYLEIPTWDKFSLSVALDAIFVPDPGIIHINYLATAPVNYSTARKIKISHSTYEKLVQSIKNQFQTKNGRPVIIANKGYGDTDNFYEGKGSFSLINTCNVWTSDRLRDIGLRHPLWSPTKYGLEFLY